MTSKGIVDPWRVVTPVVEPPREPRIDLRDIDLDADLRTPNRYTFRTANASIQVNSVRIETGCDALRDLANLLFNLIEIREAAAQLKAAGVSFETNGRAWNMGLERVGSTLATPESYLTPTRLHFADPDLNQGMERLVRVLTQAKSRPGPLGAALFKRWGITPLTKG